MKAGPTIRKRFITLLITLLCISATHARDIKDQGDGLRIEGQPGRVVVLEYSFLDAVVLAGISPVGIADDQRKERILPVIRKQLSSYTSVGLRGQPSIETIARLKPDLIIADKTRHQSIYSELQQIAPTLLLRSYGAEYPQLLKDARIIAAALDKDTEVEAALTLHQQHMNAYSQRLSNQATPTDKDKQLLFAVTSQRTMTMHGSKAFASGVMKRLGLQNAAPLNDQRAYIQIGFEQLLEMNPNWLIIGDYSAEEGGSELLRRWQKHPLWQQLSAVKSKQLLTADPLAWSLGRGIYGAERIAADLTAALTQ